MKQKAKIELGIPEDQPVNSTSVNTCISQMEGVLFDSYKLKGDQLSLKGAFDPVHVVDVLRTRFPAARILKAREYNPEPQLVATLNSCINPLMSTQTRKMIVVAQSCEVLPF